MNHEMKFLAEVERLRKELDEVYQERDKYDVSMQCVW